MLSRVANEIFWMCRYVERAENVARFIGVNLHLMLDGSFAAPENQWASLVAASGDDEDYKKRYGKYTEENVIYFLSFDRKNPNSISSCIAFARENARTLRDTISTEMWEHINQFHLTIELNRRKRTIKDFYKFLTDIKMASHLFAGLLDTTMSHGEGWQFARIGGLLERADKTARILDVKYFMLLPSMDYFNTPYDAIQWGALLKSVSGVEVYRKRFQHINYHDIIDFLVFDKTFPRSIAYCIYTARKLLEAITQELPAQPTAQMKLAELDDYLSDSNVDQVKQMGTHEFIDVFQSKVNTIGQEIHQNFFGISAAN
jgi:uncharacterized alpha-E superfamily protein